MEYRKVWINYSKKVKVDKHTEWSEAGGNNVCGWVLNFANECYKQNTTMDIEHHVWQIDT